MTNPIPESTPLPACRQVPAGQIRPIELSMLFRKPGCFFSVEELFNAMIDELPPDISATRHEAPRDGAAPATIWKNLQWSRKCGGEVNHITGDIQYATLSLPKRQTILTILDTRRINDAHDVKTRMIKRLWFSWPVRRACAVTVISEATREALLQHVPVNPDKVHVIHCCLPKSFLPRPAAFRDPPRLLQVGTTENKNLLRLADALEGIECRLRILGRPSAEQSERFRKRGVEVEAFSGLTSEQVCDLYADSDIVVFPSTYEGFGLPIIEGNAVGRPVLTSNCSSMPEVAGAAALLVNPFDVGSIREGIIRLMTDGSLRRCLIAEGRKNAQRFRPAIIAQQYADLYREVADANRRRTRRQL